MSGERYVCNLSPELLNKAVTELREPSDNAERLRAIDELRTAFDEQQYGKLLRTDDAFFLRFLRAKKFNHSKALTVLQNYHKLRVDYREVFERVKNHAVLKDMMERRILYMLKGTAKNGTKVMLYRPGLLDKDVNIWDLTAFSVVTMEKLLEDESFQICGLSSISDFTDFSLSIYFQVSISELRKMRSVWHEATPVRFKANHMINEGRIYDALMAIVRPFMKQKLLDRIKLHGKDYASLHEFIDPALLPPYLLGTGPTPEEGARAWNEIVAEEFPQDTAM